MHYTDSIEYKANLIYHSKTKEYFGEVLSSYTNDNSRSAIVMLYTVLVCDLIYKLEDLSNLYEDESARSILNTVNEEAKTSGVLSSWESKLIDEVKERTNLLDAQAKVNIDYLKQQRNLCAHPILNVNDILEKPSKEVVRACIVSILDGVFCKPPYLSKKLTNFFVTDLSQVKNELVSEGRLKRYLDEKYFSKIDQPTSDRLFKELWKFVFKLKNPDTDDNREINYRALKVLFRRNESYYSELIKQDSTYYSNIEKEDKQIINYLMQFWSSYPNIYQLMTDDLKAYIEEKSTLELQLLSMASFLYEDYETYLNALKEKMLNARYVTTRLPLRSHEMLYKTAQIQGKETIFFDFIIDLFRQSSSYNDADSNFEEYITEYQEYFTEEQYKIILKAVVENSQLRDRRRAKIDNIELYEAIKTKFSGRFNCDEYREFLVTLELEEV